MNIVEILRTNHISRWTIVATTRPQSVAEHSFNVAMLVRDWCRRVGICDVQMMKSALEHDLDEVFTGDIPTPSKRRMREAGLRPDSMEGPKKNMDKLDGHLMIVLKAIDIMEAIHYLDNYGTGKRTAHVLQLLNDTFDETVIKLGTAPGDREKSRLWCHSLQDMRKELLNPDYKDI